jgi:hypothetical protein
MLGSTEFWYEYEAYRSPHLLSLPIAKNARCRCPYADRIHRHNRSYFEYNSLNKTLKYKCFNDICKQVQRSKGIMFNLNFDKHALLRLSNMQVTPSLHCKEGIIPWSEVYEAPTMQPYPLRPITCIRANMGACKTQCLIQDFIP